MKRLIPVVFVTLFIYCILSASCVECFAYNDIKSECSYTYDVNANDVQIPDAYSFLFSIPVKDTTGIAAKNASDLFIAESGDIYIVDTDNNRIVVLDKDFNFKRAVSDFTDIDGKATNLNKPEGIYVYDTGDILIADTQNNRIVLSDENGQIKQTIRKPKDMMGVQEQEVFLPVKLTVDNVGRIYAVCRNINMGIIQMDKAGVFLGYIGAPTVQPDIFTLLWRNFSTKKQKEKMLQFVPTEYNNIVMDGQNFLWGTISSLMASDIKDVVRSKDKSGNVTPVKKLNSMGQDILKRNGEYAPLGDLKFENDPSRITDVALGRNGIYSLLDSTRGHIFTYDDNGNLLFVFGSIGTNKANFLRPVSMGYSGTRLVVLDSLLSEIKVFDTTAYGNMVLNAVDAQYNGEFSKAYQLWSLVAKYNSNCEYAFVGLGNARLSEKKYEEAMVCFKYANDKDGYSRAKELLRKQDMKRDFPILFLGVISFILLAIIVKVVKKITRYCKGYYSDDFYHS